MTCSVIWSYVFWNDNADNGCKNWTLMELTIELQPSLRHLEDINSTQTTLTLIIIDHQPFYIIHHNPIIHPTDPALVNPFRPATPRVAFLPQWDAAALVVNREVIGGHRRLHIEVPSLAWLFLCCSKQNDVSWEACRLLLTSQFTSSTIYRSWTVRMDLSVSNVPCFWVCLAKLLLQHLVSDLKCETLHLVLLLYKHLLNFLVFQML